MSWPVRVVDVTGSTNADLVAAARAGDGGPRVLVALEQTAGRGRLARRWQSPPGASVSLSVLLTPTVPQAAWTWLPMVVGLGVVDAVADLGGRALLKWPNDVVVPLDGPGDLDGTPDGTPDGARTGLAKLAGILSEAVAGPAGPAVVAGVGVNLIDPPADVGTAASLHGLLGRTPAPEEVATALAAALERRLLAWQASGGDSARVRDDYLPLCTTTGRRVRVLTPGGERRGRVVDVDSDGALVLQADDGSVAAVSAGDVEHVR